MRVYVDTGIFIDYLAQEHPGASGLRSAERRGRSPLKLYDDAKTVLRTVADGHEGATSVLTLYEVEEALLKVLSSNIRGSERASALRVVASRPIMQQALIMTRQYAIAILDLTGEHAHGLSTETALMDRGVRAADGLHLMSACAFDADVVLATDRHLHGLDGVLLNRRNRPIRCLDSDEAHMMLVASPH